MIKSGKELKVFSIPQKDLKKFTEQAKRYGVLYCVLRDKNTKGENAPVILKNTVNTVEYQYDSESGKYRRYNANYDLVNENVKSLR